MNYNKQIKIKDDRDLFGDPSILKFHWDITMICNLHCEYCYARALNDWNKILNPIMLKKVIQKLKQVKVPFYMVLLGGEPTKHPKFEHIIKLLSGIENCKKIGIITNGMHTEKIKKNMLNIFENKKIMISITYHPHVEPNEFISSVDDFFKIDPNRVYSSVMFDIKHKENIISILKYLTKNNYYFMVNNIFDAFGEEKFYNNSDEYLKFITYVNDNFKIPKLSQFSNNNNIENYNDIEIFQKKLYYFQNWLCSNNNFEIPLNSVDFLRMCTEEIYTVDEINNGLSYTVCPLKICKCQGLLSDEKIKK